MKLQAILKLFMKKILNFFLFKYLIEVLKNYIKNFAGILNPRRRRAAAANNSHN
jgi:hypothetical protein